jgi:hypothetical protein
MDWNMRCALYRRGGVQSDLQPAAASLRHRGALVRADDPDGPDLGLIAVSDSDVIQAVGSSVSQLFGHFHDTPSEEHTTVIGVSRMDVWARDHAIGRNPRAKRLGRHKEIFVQLPQLRRIRWAVRAALFLGVAASVAANVLHALPNPISQTISAWPPLALLLTVELTSRIPMHKPLLAALRVLATIAIAGHRGVGVVLAHAGRSGALRRDRGIGLPAADLGRRPHRGGRA